MTRQHYERRQKKLDPMDVHRAIWMTRNPSPTARVVEWADTDCPGLVIRITKSDANWLIRRRNMTIRIGSCEDVDLSTARHITHKARDAAKRGRNLKTFVETLAHMKSAGHPYRDPRDDDWRYADEIANEQSEWGRRWLRGELQPVWTWKNLTDRFLDEKLPKIKESYREEYARYLRLPAYELVNDMIVPAINIEILEEVRDRMLTNHALSTVSRSMRQAREMLTWGWSYRIKNTGLKDCKDDWWRRWRVEYKSGIRTRRPSIGELARTLVLADEFRNLAEGEHETYPGTVCALWMTVLTAQRTGSLVMMRPDRLFEPGAGLKLHGWKIANWTIEEMKGGRDGGRPHSLPLPPRLLRALERFQSEYPGRSEWTFCGKNPKERLTQFALNQLMYRLQGRVYDHRKKNKPDRPGKPGPKPAAQGKIRKDLFAEFAIEPWTLHDVRRSITRFLDDNRLGGAASAILGHQLDNDKMPEEERRARVTEQHYNSSQRLPLKAEGMKIWVDAILDACERERINIKKRATVKQSQSQHRSLPA